MNRESENTNPLSIQRTTSASYQEVDFTAKNNGDHSLKEYDSEIVYDEIPESAMRHSNQKTVASTKPVGPNMIQLKENSAYRK